MAINRNKNDSKYDFGKSLPQDDMSDEEKEEFNKEFGEESDRRTRITVIGALIIIAVVLIKVLVASTSS